MRTAGQLSHLVTIDFQSKTIRTGQEDPVAAPLCWVIGWIIYDNLREMLQETKFSCHEKMEKKTCSFCGVCGQGSIHMPVTSNTIPQS
jgi:hypothetical protein